MAIWFWAVDKVVDKWGIVGNLFGYKLWVSLGRSGGGI